MNERRMKEMKNEGITEKRKKKREQK